MTEPSGPHIGVLSSLFPSSVQPGAGLFVRERMFRVARRLPLAVVSPVPWFPLQDIIRRWKPKFRPGAPAYEMQQGIPVWFPRFLSLPGLLKQCDGRAMAWAAYACFAALRQVGQLDLIDAHFGYPDGYAAVLLGRRLGVPVTITLRGNEVLPAQEPHLRPRLRAALLGATRVFSVSDSLRQLALELGVPEERTEVISNGVDAERFQPRDRLAARAALGLPADVPVLISVGWLVERKGFHRVIEVLPALRRRWPGLTYLIVGAGNAAGDYRPDLEALAARLGVSDAVRFLGALPPDALSGPLSAADVFVLATSREGWANVFLEAMACGLPVITTDVGGNREVVCRPELGEIVPFGDAQALAAAIERALSRAWDRAAIRQYAVANSWDGRVERLCQIFTALTEPKSGAECHA
jgi:glycosyltransferase involved in cell wall biosynthesis